MPYHQAAIRELEMPVAGHTGAGLMTLSEGARVFTRYGYADLLRDDRRYTVRHRVFSGTQRLLLSGDAGLGRGLSRAYQFCGSTGADLMEPLTCRGRRGTGGAGQSSGICRRYARAAVGLAEVRLLVSAERPVDVRPGHQLGRLAAADAVRRRWNRRWRTPAAFCPSSPRRTCPRRHATRTGRRSIGTSRW